MSLNQTVSSMKSTVFDLPDLSDFGLFNLDCTDLEKKFLLSLTNNVTVIQNSDPNVIIEQTDFFNVDELFTECLLQDEIITQEPSIVNKTLDSQNSEFNLEHFIALNKDNVSTQLPVSKSNLDHSNLNLMSKSSNTDEIFQILSQNFNFEEIDNLSQSLSISDEIFDIESNKSENSYKKPLKNMKLMFDDFLEDNSSESSLSIADSQIQTLLSPQPNLEVDSIPHVPFSSQKQISMTSSHSISPILFDSDSESSTDFIPCSQPHSHLIVKDNIIPFLQSTPKPLLLNSQFDVITQFPNSPNVCIEGFDALSNSSETNKIVTDHGTQTDPPNLSLNKNSFVVKAKHKNSKFSRNLISNLKSVCFALNSYHKFRNVSSEENVMWDRINFCFNKLADVDI